MSEPNFEDVFIDTHNYQVFNDDFQTWDWPTHIQVGGGISTAFLADDTARAYAIKPATTLLPLFGSWSANGPLLPPTARNG